MSAKTGMTGRPNPLIGCQKTQKPEAMGSGICGILGVDFKVGPSSVVEQVARADEDGMGDLCMLGRLAMKKLLVGTAAGLCIFSTAAFSVQPSQSGQNIFAVLPLLAGLSLR
jgi:hypothetical protein